ncbi:hypothetical protein FXO37_00021 [Capsicum annuum]|nr:hypothetical protein FXO37_00021 [Capsicum annuum]
MNTGRRNVSKEIIKILTLPLKSWSKPSALIVILYTYYDKKKHSAHPKKGKGKSSDHDDLVSIFGPSFKNKNLIEALKGVNKNISIGLIKLSKDLEAFNSYPWVYESFKMTVQYLLTPLMPKTVNLYDFPWAFMAWAFEAIPYFRQQVNYQEEVSCPRILRWLSAKTDRNTKFLDIFNPPPPQGSNVTVEATVEKHNITVDNPSTAFKEEEKVKPVKWIADGLLKHHAGRKQNDEHYKVKSSLGFDMFDFVVAHLEIKNWFYLMSQSQTCWNDELEVSRNEKRLINIIKGFSISVGLPWHLIDEVYIPINCGDEFHWVLAVVVLQDRRIRVYESMSRTICCGPSSEIQKLAKILPTYLDISGFLDQKVHTNWSTIEAYRDKMGNPFDVQYVEGITQ